MIDPTPVSVILFQYRDYCLGVPESSIGDFPIIMVESCVRPDRISMLIRDLAVYADLGLVETQGWELGFPFSDRGLGQIEWIHGIDLSWSEYVILE